MLRFGVLLEKALEVFKINFKYNLTSILAPEIFGIMSTCFVFLTMVQLFSDVGLKPKIIQNKEGDSPEYLNTAWCRHYSIFYFIYYYSYCHLSNFNFYQNESLQLILFCLSFHNINFWI